MKVIQIVQKRLQIIVGSRAFFHTLGLIFVASIILIFLSLFVKGQNTGTLLYQYDYNTQVGGPLEASNSTSRYALTEAIVKDRTFFLDMPLAKLASPDVVQYKGKFISIFTPGVSFLGVPFYILGQYLHAPQLGTYLLTVLAATANLFLIGKLAQKLGAGKLAGLLGGICFLFATNALSYSLTFTQHHLSVFLILLALLNTFNKRTWIQNILLGSCLGLGILTDIPNFFMMLPIIIFVVLQHIHLQILKEKLKVSFRISAIALLFGLIPFIIFFALYNHATTGSYTKIGQTIGRTTAFATPSALTPKVIATTNNDKTPATVGISLPFQTRSQLGGLYTLILSNERAWWYYSPIVLVGILGIILLYKNHQYASYTTLILSVILVDITAYSMFGDPWGGWAFGPRYLIPAAALMCVFLGVAIEKLKKNPFFITLFFSLLAYSLYVNFMGALTTSAIPPRIEAESLSNPIPYTYAYNVQFLGKNLTSSLFYNVILDGILSVQQFLFILVGIALLLISGLYADLLFSVRGKIE